MKIKVTYIESGTHPIKGDFDVDNYHVGTGGTLELIINGESSAVFSPSGWISLFREDS